MKEHLSRFINHPRTDLAVVILVLISVVLVILEIALAYDRILCQMIEEVSDGITGIFIVELLIRCYVAPKKSRFFRQYWIDILAVLPMTRSFRILRILRLLRIFRMAVIINRRISKLSSAFKEGASAYLVILFITFILVLSGALGIVLLEGKINPDFRSLDKAVWWAVLSLVAGEPSGGMPTTQAGKMLTLFIMVGGLTVFAMLTGVVSAVMVRKFRFEEKAMDLDELKDHVVICGWNRAVPIIINELHRDPDFSRRGVVLIAEMETIPAFHGPYARPELIFTLLEDYTKLEVLERANIKDATVAIILADKTKPRSDQDRDARTILTALIVEDMNPNIFTCVELLNRDNSSQLTRMGVEEVVVGDEYTGHLLATASRNRGIVPLFQELLSARLGNEFFKLPVPEDLVGQTFLDAMVAIKRDYDAIAVSVEVPEGTNGKHKALLNPPADLKLLATHRLVVMAQDKPTLQAVKLVRSRGGR